MWTTTQSTAGTASDIRQSPTASCPGGITFIAQRIPNTNPFQDHVDGAAGFFLATSEAKANAALTGAGSRYIITDGSMAAGSFPNIAYWRNTTAGVDPYAAGLLVPVPGRENTYSIESFYKEAYYRTMVLRLQAFDGTMVVPSEALYVEYDTASIPETGYARLVDNRTLSPAGARAAADTYSGPRSSGATSVRRRRPSRRSGTTGSSTSPHPMR